MEEMLFKDISYLELRYWVMFQMALGHVPNLQKVCFFPNFKEKSKFKGQKNITILWHLNCAVPLQIVFLHSNFLNVLISES